MFDTLKSEKSEKKVEKNLKKVKQNFSVQGVKKPWIWIRIRIRIGEKCWIRIRIETYADPKHCL